MFGSVVHLSHRIVECQKPASWITLENVENWNTDDTMTLLLTTL